MLFFLVCVALIFTLKMKLYYQTKTFTDDGLTGANLASATIDIHDELGYKSDVNNFHYEDMYETYVKCLGYNLEAVPTNQKAVILTPTTTRHYVSNIHILKFYVYNKTKEGDITLAKVVDSENINKGAVGIYYGDSRVSTLDEAVTPDGTHISDRPSTLMIYSQISFDLPSVFGNSKFINSVIKPIYVTKQHTVDVVSAHNYKVTEHVDATCTEEGYEVLTCQDDGCEEHYTRALNPLGHHMQPSIMEGSIGCLVGGYRVSKCSRCDYEERRYIDALGHNMGDWLRVKEPSYTEDGIEKRICLRCGYEELRYVDALIPDVNIDIIKKKRIDIAFNRRNSEFNIDNIKTDLVNKLKENNIDPEIVAILTTSSQTIDSKNLNFASIVNSWRTIGARTWTATSDGKIYSNVDGDNGWYGTALINPYTDADNIEFSFTMVTGGRLNEGVCFNVTINPNGTLSGYFLSICNHANSSIWLYKFENYQLNQSFSTGINSRLWCNPYQTDCLTNSHTAVIGRRYTSGSSAFTPLACYNSVGDYNVKYNIKYTRNHIVVNANHIKVIDLRDTSYTHGTYGFWGNNCEQKAKMYISDFKVTVSNEKTYKEALKDINWNVGSSHYFIDIDDGIDDTINNDAELPATIGKSISDEVHFIQVGTDANKNIATNFISEIDGRGTYTDNSGYDEALNKIVAYIKEDQTEELTNIFILNSGIKCIIKNSNLITGTATSSFPNGRWYVSHNPSYYNSTEIATNANQYTTSLNCKFDQPGEYKIYYDDILRKTIYINRIPIADFNYSISGNLLTLTNTSYDLDSHKNVGFGEGIANEQWYYKESLTGSWKAGKLKLLNANKTYLVKLEITDFQDNTKECVKWIK